MTFLVAMLAILTMTAPAPAGLARAEEDSVLEAVFVAKLGELREAARVSLHEPRVFCLAVNPGEAPQTPGREFMARFKDQPDVRPAGHCETRRGRVVEIGTGAGAVLLTAGPSEWIAGDEAWVTLSVLQDQRHSFTTVYRVVRERDKWTALGPVMKISPS